jgi:hypothetical protein
MSFLSPLYLLGLLAVTAPVLFHLIRRSPRGQIPFSSLMFLNPSPPRLTRRSRLDHLLLLLLRAMALSLLALAFTRPFLRQEMRFDSGVVDQRRIALLIDTSASLRRGDLWTRAKALAGQAIDDCLPTDQLAVFAFDASSRPLLSFDESATLDPARRQSVAKARLERLAPTWAATNLGQALIDVVAAIEDVADRSEKAGRMPRRIVLVSDLQQGSRLDDLGEFEWPADVELDLKTVSDDGSNAALHRLAARVDAEPADHLRVRVFNDSGSRRENFHLHWVSQTGAETDKPIDIYVPPGESRIVRVPRPTDRASSLRSLQLTGDSYDFDNTLFLADERPEEATVLYLGADRADDPNGLLYYLQRVFLDTSHRRVHIRSSRPSEVLAWDSKSPPPLILLTAETTPENISRLQNYLRGGGTLLYVLAAAGRVANLVASPGAAPWDVEEAPVRRDVMLGEIVFDHPLFAPMAGAQYSDFTKIRFWKYRRISSGALGDARILARFENGDAWILEKPLEKGRLFVLTSGWQPADSQLARSSKFVPLMASLLDYRRPVPFDAANHQVQDRVALPVSSDADQRLEVHKPAGHVIPLPAGATSFAETDEPGIYRVDTPAGPRSFAVNLDPMESKTSPLHVETLEQFGCRLVNHARKPVDREQLRQMHNAELEGRQKLWRWLILAAILILIVETWLAGRIRQPRLARVEALST